MLKRCLLICAVIAACAGAHRATAPSQIRHTNTENTCVSCHSRISKPAALAGRYLDWYSSEHKKNGVTCDKCHGGDPSIRDVGKVHQAVQPPSMPASRLHEDKLPQTCGGCHRAVANAFIESTHYQRLKSSNLGPTCTTCHGHMASSIARYPPQGASFCAHCHNTVNGMLAPRPEIPKRAEATLEALGRANYIVVEVGDLLAEAQKRKLNVVEEKEDLRLLKGLLTEAKVGWHAFTSESVQTKAEKAFDEGMRLRNQLNKLLGRN